MTKHFWCFFFVTFCDLISRVSYGQNKILATTSETNCFSVQCR